MSNRVIDYIESHWDICIRENREDDGTLIGLPYPYIVSGTTGKFHEMYYWGTWFTNQGLKISGRWDLVKSNTDNMLHMVDKFGYMLNANRLVYIYNSQPPFLSLMVREVYEHYRDLTWLASAYRVLNKEYKFWQTERNISVQLNNYSGQWPDELVEEKTAGFIRRVGVRPDGKTDRQIADHYFTCCESGIDCSQRWGFEGYDYAMVDLNSLLYMFEQNMAHFSKLLDAGDEATWIAAAEKRRARMLKYMDNGGILYDYNIKEGKTSDFFTCASVYPLFANMLNKTYAESFVKNLGKIEYEYGIAYAEKSDFPGEYQWADKIGWPCIQHLLVKALDNYGFTVVAKRIAEKYLGLVEKTFDETGQLWEKYNIKEGNINVTAEYVMPPIMGRTAAIYLVFKKYLEEGII